MIKKIVCAAIMTALLVSQAVCVLADEPTRSVVTTTNYDAVNKQISVTTTVSGVKKDDEITYLAYTGEDVTDESIAYIDQKTVTESDAGTVKFEYVAETKFNGSKVMVGGLNKSANAAFAVDATGSINATINAVVKIVNGDVSTDYEVTPVTTDDGFTFIKNAAVEGTTLSDGAADVTWFAAADGIWVANKALNGKDKITLAWSGAAPEIAVTPVLAKIGNIGDKLIVLAKKARGAAEYGIKLSEKAITEGALAVNDSVDVTEAEVSTLKDSIVKYAALGTDAEGNYAVVISGVLTADVEYNVAAYSDFVNTKAVTIKNEVATAE